MQQRKSKHEEVIVRYTRERWRAADSDFVIGEAVVINGNGKPSGKVGILGDAPRFGLNSLSVGLQYVLIGKWEEDERAPNGKQFRFDSFDLHRPSSKVGIVKYLCQCRGNSQVRGIGKTTAETLYDAYGDSCIDKLIEDPDAVANETGRFPVESARLCSQQLKLLEDTRHVKIELMGLVDGFGFPRTFIRWAIDRWGADAVNRLKQNPYRAMGARSVGFLKADAFYKHVGQERFGDNVTLLQQWLSSLKRQAYAGWYEIASDTQGHVWYPRRRFVKGIKDRIGGVPDINEDRAIELAKRGKVIDVYKDRAGVDWVSDSRPAKAEEYIANHIADAFECAATDLCGENLASSGGIPYRKLIDWPSIDEIKEADKRLTDHHQLPAIASAMSGPIGLLIGSAGTGKSTCMAAIVRAIVHKHGSTSVCVCSPTGKAAVVCTQKMLDVGINIRAKTIHSTLGVEHADDGSGWRFRHNESNPLPFQFIIVDEASMIPCDLLASFLNARTANTGIILTGDSNQLPPVGRGSPLRDFIRAGLPCGTLTEVHRNAGTIAHVCAAIRDGMPFSGDTRLAPDETPPRNLIFIHASKAEAPGRAIELVNKIKDQGLFDPVDDLQVLVAVNDRSPLGRNPLSLKIRDELNPHGDTQKGCRFRVGDKVVQRSNGFFNDAERKGDEHFIANGDIGRVKSIQPKTVVVEFKEPYRLVRMPMSKPNGDGDKDDGGSGGDLQLAYCLTVHSSQGSQWPITIVCIDEYPGATGRVGICNREFWYTALSRASKVCIVIGDKSIMEKTCRRSGIASRKTFLVERINELMAERNLSFSGVGSDLSNGSSDMEPHTEGETELAPDFVDLFA